jgi:hypothetical protein
MTVLAGDPTATAPLEKPKPVDERYVPCVYCRTRIPAATFAYWSDAKRLLFANCPTCARRMTLPAANWTYWGEP